MVPSAVPSESMNGCLDRLSALAIFEAENEPLTVTDTPRQLAPLDEIEPVITPPEAVPCKFIVPRHRESSTLNGTDKAKLSPFKGTVTE